MSLFVSHTSPTKSLSISDCKTAEYGNESLNSYLKSRVVGVPVPLPSLTQEPLLVQNPINSILFIIYVPFRLQGAVLRTLLFSTYTTSLDTITKASSTMISTQMIQFYIISS